MVTNMSSQLTCQVSLETMKTCLSSSVQCHCTSQKMGQRSKGKDAETVELQAHGPRAHCLFVSHVYVLEKGIQSVGGSWYFQNFKNHTWLYFSDFVHGVSTWFIGIHGFTKLTYWQNLLNELHSHYSLQQAIRPLKMQHLQQWRTSTICWAIHQYIYNSENRFADPG